MDIISCLPFTSITLLLFNIVPAQENKENKKIKPKKVVWYMGDSNEPISFNKKK